MRTITLLVVLLTAAPVVGQSRLYTNADLGRPLSPNRGTVDPAILQALRDHQYQAPPTPAREFEPWMTVMGSSSTAGPFGEFAPFDPPRRLDGSSWLDPEPVYGLPPWGAWGHGYPGNYDGPSRGFDRRGDRARGRPAEHEVRPTTAPLPPRSLVSPPARAAGRILRY
jgi:hypothetical protein